VQRALHRGIDARLFQSGQARRIGTPALSSVYICRLNNIMSTGMTLAWRSFQNVERLAAIADADGRAVSPISIG
jgi:hypothetical protein